MSTISDIVARLHSRSEADRREVLRRVSALFLERPTERTDRETEIFGRIFVDLLGQVAADDRIDFSDQFAAMPVTPSEVAHRLADDDDPRVAAPMLSRSPVLSEEVLRDIAGRRGPAHLVAIARRERLGTELTDVLVERGDVAVHEVVSGNGGALFSDGSLARLARSALESEGVATALFRRLDISQERFERILTAVEPEAQERLGRLLLTNRRFATALLAGTLDAAASQRSRERAEAEAFVDLVRTGERRLDGCVEDLAREDRVEDIAHLMGTLAEIAEAHVASVLGSANDFGLALLCRSLDLGESGWVALDRLRRRCCGEPEGEVETIVAAYRQVDRVSAERAMRFHRIRSQLR